MLKSGFSFQQCLHILEEKNTALIFEKINDRLNAGERINDFIYVFLPLSWQKYFQGFIFYMSLEEALECSMYIVKEEKKALESILQGTLYPCLLFMGTCLGIKLFSHTILPSMISLMNGFKISTTNLFSLQIGIEVFSSIGLIVASVISIVLTICFQKHNIVSVYRFVARKMPNSVMVMLASEDFTRFFLECERRNISTYSTLTILKEISQKPLVQYVAGQLDDALSEGETMEQAIYHSSVETALIRLFRTAIRTSSCVEMMESYLEMTHQRTIKRIKKISLSIQLLSYSAIGSVLILVYQVLLIPMQMLQNI